MEGNQQWGLDPVVDMNGSCAIYLLSQSATGLRCENGHGQDLAQYLRVFVGSKVPGRPCEPDSH